MSVTTANIALAAASIREAMAALGTAADLLEGKTTAPKAPRTQVAADIPAAAAAKPARKSDRTLGEGMTRKDWNRTLTTLAKTQPKGSGAYQAVLAAWDLASDLRAKGATPAAALQVILAR